MESGTLTGVGVHHFHLSDFSAGLVVDLQQPRLQVDVRITYFIEDEQEVFTGFLSFALNQLQDFAHLKHEDSISVGF